MAPGIAISGVLYETIDVTIGDPARRIDVASSVSRQPVNNHSNLFQFEPLFVVNYTSSMRRTMHSTAEANSQLGVYRADPNNKLRRSLNSIAQHDAENLTSCSSPTAELPQMHLENQPMVDKTLLNIPQDIREEMRTLSDRLVGVECSEVSLKPTNEDFELKPIFLPKEDHSATSLCEYAAGQTAIKPKKFVISITYTPINNNQAIRYTSQLPKSAFKPVHKPISSSANIIKATNDGRLSPTYASTAANRFNSLSPPCLSTWNFTQPMTYTTNSNELFQNFRGMTDKRPVQFLTEFEIRASTIIGENENLFLKVI